MTVSDLKCTVDECHFWGKGNHCTAKGVEVNPEAGKAHNSADTLCKTYKPKGY